MALYASSRASRSPLDHLTSLGWHRSHSRSRHPDELYQNGIQRTSFLPCIDMIKDRFHVVDLDSGTGQYALIVTNSPNPFL